MLHTIETCVISNRARVFKNQKRFHQMNSFRYIRKPGLGVDGLESQYVMSNRRGDCVMGFKTCRLWNIVIRPRGVDVRSILPMCILEIWLNREDRPRGRPSAPSVPPRPIYRPKAKAIGQGETYLRT